MRDIFMQFFQHPLLLRGGTVMKTTKDFKKMKESKDPIVVLTSYDFPSAKIAEDAGVEMILVGDSLGMVVLGYDSTIPVTMEDMIHHTKAVRRGAPNTFVIADMPFMSYHSSLSESMNNARRLMQDGQANAVKLEGGGEVIDLIKKLTSAGVPVVAHLGLTPQTIAVMGGYKVQGKDREAAKQLLQDAIEVQEAGAFALVLECVPKELAKVISEELTIPTIGIGAGNQTDGQVLVYHDLVGYGSYRVPKFVKQYTSITSSICDAITQYKDEVKEGLFPTDAHSFKMDAEEISALYGGK
jgi:3-methyl-2-oxobutanoate hydroxymethyltransferase